MSSNPSREQARALASNLASLWTGGRNVLDTLVESAGELTASPIAALSDLSDETFTRLLSEGGRASEMEAAFRQLSRYLASDTWFDRAEGENEQLKQLRRNPIAYFCMEYGLASWLPIYSGGLGVLAGDMLKEASDMGLPFVAVGLFYEHGFFSQRLDENNYQTEIVPTLDPRRLPLEATVNSAGQELRVSIPLADRNVLARIWKLRVGRVPLYLLDTDVPENEQEDDRQITSSLYGGNEETRIRQELVLGIGGIRALRALGIEPSVFSMNEGHAAFLGLEILADYLRDDDFDSAVARTRCHVVYTNHTVVPAGNDVFTHGLVRTYLSRYAEERGIGTDRLLALATPRSHDLFSMPLLAFGLSGKANAVSELHAKIIPREWPGYSVDAITNGVHVPTWIGREITALLDEFIPDWHSDRPSWDRIHDMPDERLWEARQAQRRTMIAAVNDAQKETTLDDSALTIVWARRFAEYKRAWLVASDLARLSKILANAKCPVQLIISGKSHPRDEGGKRTMQDLLQRVENDSGTRPRVAFVEDYNERIARFLVAGADVWLNTPRKPLEASGTSGMKSSDNGGLQLTVTDGWAAEVDWWGVGWGMEGRDDHFDAQQLYGFLEDSVVPTFYTRDAHGIPAAWVAMMKNTMLVTLKHYSSRRMVLDYLNKLYLPLVEGQSALSVV